MPGYSMVLNEQRPTSKPLKREGGREMMKIRRVLFVLFIGLCLTSIGYGGSEKLQEKKKILVVSSYHREYSWSRETNEGLCAAMLKFGYFDNKDQAAEYTKNDYVETSKIILKKLWMDAKRKSSKEEMAKSTLEITKNAGDFKPDLIFLGDDDAAQYIGNQFLDTKIPIVFWGVNNTPVKYGLVDSAERPGHNVTGLSQPGYKVESLELLKTIMPGVKTFAVLCDATSAGRNHVKMIEYLDRQKKLPLTLVETVSTDDYEEWKKKALELQKKVDAFFVAQYSGLKDGKGNYVPAEKAAEWYVTHITIPETADQGQFVKQGMLCGVNDWGYNSGFEAVVIARDILNNGANPATYPPRVPKRGAFMANRQRAKILGIAFTQGMGIEEYIEEASALKDVSR